MATLAHRAARSAGRTQNVERVYHDWDEALSRNDVEGLLALYADDAVLESPLVRHLLRSESDVCRGRKELRRLLEAIVWRRPDVRPFHRMKYFTDGRTLIWQYPQATPDGEQMDFLEAMEIEDGLIRHHRVYWGWYGVEVLEEDRYRRS